MKELIIALGLFLFIEGILYALFPSKMKSMLKKIDLIGEGQLRTGGLIFAFIGFVIIYYMNVHVIQIQQQHRNECGIFCKYQAMSLIM